LTNATAVRASWTEHQREPNGVRRHGNRRQRLGHCCRGPAGNANGSTSTMYVVAAMRPAQPLIVRFRRRVCVFAARRPVRRFPADGAVSRRLGGRRLAGTLFGETATSAGRPIAFWSRRAWATSASLTRDTTTPLAPARPVRPERWR